MSKRNQALLEAFLPNERVLEFFRQGREPMAISVYLRQISDLDRAEILKIISESATLSKAEASE